MNLVLPIAILSIAFIGWVMTLIGGIRILISAFRKSIIWGLGCLLVPFCGLVYLIVDWDNAKSGFFLQLKGFGVILLVGLTAAVVVPNFKAAQNLKRVHARQQVSAGPSDEEQSPTNRIEKSLPIVSIFQKKQPATNASPSHPPLRLQGISFNPTRPSAILNGNTLFVGEKAAGWTVTAISSQTVTLQDDSGQTNTLSLH